MKETKQGRAHEIYAATYENLPKSGSKGLYKAYYNDRNRLAAYWYRGYFISLRYDDDALNPRENYSHLSKIVVAGCKNACGINEIGASINNEGDWDGIIEIQGDPPVVSMPLYCCEGSGVTITTDHASLPYGRCCGIATATEKDITGAFCIKSLGQGDITKAKKIIEEEMRALSAYLSGLVYVAVVYDKDGEVIESMGDCYEQESALEYAMDIIDEQCEVKNGKKDSNQG